MSNRMSGRRARGGFTLAEVVVALAVIVIVTAAAMTLISSQATLEADTIHTVEAASIAENAIECFRYSKKHASEDFIDAYNTVYDLGDENTANTDGVAFEQICNGTTYKVLFKIEGNTISVTVSIGDGDTPIIEQSYTYGDT